MPTQVNSDCLITRRQVDHLRLPVGVRAAEAMHEHDGRRTVTTYDMMNDDRFTHLTITPGARSVALSVVWPMAAPPSNVETDREVLAATVERVTYYNAENGFCVLRIKARGHRDLVTIVGHAATIAAGEWITAAGDWVNDHTHGQQFKARFVRTSAPSSIEGIEKYLASGMIRGIGPVYTKKMVKAFGHKVFDIIEAEPDRMREVDGIGPVRARHITLVWTRTIRVHSGDLQPPSAQRWTCRSPR
jgi:hypothetical protein